MHSQAFVSFPDVASAQLAQQSVNGYLLHDRPLILVRNVLTLDPAHMLLKLTFFCFFVFLKEFGKSPSGNALISEQSSTKDKIGP